MKKSILITGRQGSGKTTKLKELLSNHSTMFYIDGAVSADEIESIHSAAVKANSFCVIATQLDIKSLSENVLSSFEIVNCNAVS
jgi:dephospho-CoA kinase